MHRMSAASDPRRGLGGTLAGWSLPCTVLSVGIALAGGAEASPLPRPGGAQLLTDHESTRGVALPVLLAQARRRHRRRPAAVRPKPKIKTAPPSKTMERATPEEATPEAQPKAAATPEAANLQRGGRIEFDGRLVQGQTAKSGAIYLFARQRTDLKSMVRERETYRKEILRTVYPEEAQ